MKRTAFRRGSPSAAEERARVARHVGRGQRKASRAVPPPRSRATMLARGLLLGALQEYWRDGRFPKNPGFPWQVPVFVDGEGTRCAIAHLMELGGAGRLVAEIASLRNFAFVRELADDPRVATWLEAAGITVDEAAEIQPSYCQTAWSECICGDPWNAPGPGAGADGVMEGVTVHSTTGGDGVQVIAIHGDVGVAQVGAIYKVTDGSALRAGAPVLVPVSRSTTPEFYGIGPSGDDSGFSSQPAPPNLTTSMLLLIDGSGRPLRCNAGEETTLPVTKAQVVTALRSNDCRGEMAKVDSDWSDAPSCGGACGCSAVGLRGEDAGVAVLLAVAGAMIARRRARVRG